VEAVVQCVAISPRGKALKTELWRGYMGGLLTSFEEPGLGRAWRKTPLPIDLLDPSR
jgi:hypothetical protein